MTTERIDPLAVMNDSAVRLRTKGCTEFATDLDAARLFVAELVEASARTVRAFEGLGKAKGVVPNLEAHRECEAALVAQKAALAAFGRQG